MTQKQFDILYTNQCKLIADVEQLINRTNDIEQRLSMLENKTLVVTTLDSDVEKLKLDVAALKDEQEA